MALRLAFGAFILTYFLSTAFITASKRNSIWLRMVRFSSERLLLAMSRASLFITTSTSFRLLLTSVEPLLTISNIASASPMPGLISTLPVMTCISAFILFFSRNSCNITGYDVAIFFPLNHSSPLYSWALGMARESLHLLNPRRFTISAFPPRSTYSFSPTMPRSATPVLTLCGMSSSLR